MAVPTSGELKFSGLAKEITQNDYNSTLGTTNISLAQLNNFPFEPINLGSSSHPNPAAPHSVSEWYGYDHDAFSYATFVTGKKYFNSLDACTKLADVTKWFSGTGWPDVGDFAYSTSDGLNFLENGYYKVEGNGYIYVDDQFGTQPGRISGKGNCF